MANQGEKVVWTGIWYTYDFYCLVTKAHVCEQFVQSCTWKSGAVYLGLVVTVTEQLLTITVLGRQGGFSIVLSKWQVTTKNSWKYRCLWLILATIWSGCCIDQVSFETALARVNRCCLMGWWGHAQLTLLRLLVQTLLWDL